MKNKLLTLVICIILGSCAQNNQSDQKEEKDNNKTNFGKYSEKIKFIDLPLKANCEKALEGSKLDFTDSIITKYGEAGSRIYGKLAENKNYTAIIYLVPADVVLPVIVTNDKKGNRISRLAFYENLCGEDGSYKGISWTKISKDLSITLSDSSINLKREPKGKIIESTRKTTVRHRKFFITDYGKIEDISKKL